MTSVGNGEILVNVVGITIVVINQQSPHQSLLPNPIHLILPRTCFSISLTHHQSAPHRQPTAQGKSSNTSVEIERQRRHRWKRRDDDATTSPLERGGSEGRWNGKWQSEIVPRGHLRRLETQALLTSYF